jgi:hypothetical protein
MSDILDRETLNALVVAVHKAIVATFNEGDWRSLGFQTDSLPFVERHSRLLQSLSWNDLDYREHAMTAVVKMLGDDLANLDVMLKNPKIVAWLRENEVILYATLFGGDEPIDAIPLVDHGTAIQNFLWRRAADVSLTEAFRQQRHDDMLECLREKADTQLLGQPRVSILQSLHDAGCDLTVDWDAGAKYGVQLKSHADINKTDFSTRTISQIQDSRQHGLQRLYVLLAGDLTDKSQVQKVRILDSRVSIMKDKYVRVVPPERLWTLLFEE